MMLQQRNIYLFAAILVFFNYWSVTGNNATETEILILRRKHKRMAFCNLSTLKKVTSETHTLLVMI